MRQQLIQRLNRLLPNARQNILKPSERIVVVDSFRSVVRNVLENEVQIQGFVQQLGLLLTTWEATTFLIGEYVDSELRDNPVFTIADCGSRKLRSA